MKQVHRMELVAVLVLLIAVATWYENRRSRHLAEDVTRPALQFSELAIVRAHAGPYSHFDTGGVDLTVTLNNLGKGIAEILEDDEGGQLKGNVHLELERYGDVVCEVGSRYQDTKDGYRPYHPGELWQFNLFNDRSPARVAPGSTHVLDISVYVYPLACLPLGKRIPVTVTIDLSMRYRSVDTGNVYEVKYDDTATATVLVEPLFSPRPIRKRKTL